MIGVLGKRNKDLFIVDDYFTKQVEAYPLEKQREKWSQKSW